LISDSLQTMYGGYTTIGSGIFTNGPTFPQSTPH
jgi:hypothetical protein